MINHTVIYWSVFGTLGCLALLIPGLVTLKYRYRVRLTITRSARRSGIEGAYSDQCQGVQQIGLASLSGVDDMAEDILFTTSLAISPSHGSSGGYATSQVDCAESEV
jgi:hypothetical protein